MNIGDNIARIRKAKGITQERLGELMGVSAQAVSKWENGGAPDVALLPMLAENLGVSVDSLFGLEDRPAGTMAQTLRTWLLSMPADRRIPEMYRALAGSFYTLIQDLGGAVDSRESLPTKTAYETVGDDEVFYRAYIDAGCGQALGILGEDFPMYLLMPRPEGGYARNLADVEDYRRLFACLAKPGVLELLCCLHSSSSTRFSAGAFSRLTGQKIGGEVIQSLMELNLLQVSTVELEQGEEKIYSFCDVGAFVPLLYMARWFMETERQWWNIFCHYKSKPLLGA